MRRNTDLMRLCRFLNGADGRGAATFEFLCSEAGLDLIYADNLLYRHFGMSGEEILCKIRSDSVAIAV